LLLWGTAASRGEERRGDERGEVKGRGLEGHLGYFPVSLLLLLLLFMKLIITTVLLLLK
jgi:hypothetical protein